MGAILTCHPQILGAEASRTIPPPHPALRVDVLSVWGKARGVQVCAPGWGGRLGWVSEPGSEQPWAPWVPSSLRQRPHVLCHAYPHSEEEPHAAGGEHSPLCENQQLCGGPGPGGGDVAGAHHPRVTVSARWPARAGLQGHGAQRGRCGAQACSPRARHLPPALGELGPLAARGRTQCPGTKRGEEQGHFPPSLGTRSSRFDLGKTKLIIFHLFLRRARLRRLFFSPLAPSPAPKKETTLFFSISP